MANPKPVKNYSAARLGVSLGVACLFIVTVWFFGQPAQDGHLKDRPVPDFSFKLPNGHSTRLAALQGKVLLLNFWASWCEPCMEEMPVLRELEEHFAGKSFMLLAFDVEEEDRGKLGSQKSKLPENLIFDYSRARLQPYNVSAIPLSVLVDRAGIVRATFRGPRDWMDGRILSEIEGLIQPNGETGK